MLLFEYWLPQAKKKKGTCTECSLCYDGAGLFLRYNKKEVKVGRLILLGKGEKVHHRMWRNIRLIHQEAFDGLFIVQAHTRVLT